MGKELLDSLIRFHRSTLLQNRQFISVSTVYLEEQTIKALEELKEGDAYKK